MLYLDADTNEVIQKLNSLLMTSLGAGALKVSGGPNAISIHGNPGSGNHPKSGH